jgi:hypothetical protein
MYRAVDVWGHMSESQAVRFRCFQNLHTGMYSVQSSDFYSLPVDPERLRQLEEQHAALFIETPPDKRSGAFPTLEAAIDAHIASFGSSES